MRPELVEEVHDLPVQAFSVLLDLVGQQDGLLVGRELFLLQNFIGSPFLQWKWSEAVKD